MQSTLLATGSSGDDVLELPLAIPSVSSVAASSTVVLLLSAAALVLVLSPVVDSFVRLSVIVSRVKHLLHRPRWLPTEFPDQQLVAQPSLESRHDVVIGDVGYLVFFFSEKRRM
jgi:hypothetical protein